MLPRFTVRLAAWVFVSALALSLALFPISHLFRERTVMFTQELNRPAPTMSTARPSVGFLVLGIQFSARETFVLLRPVTSGDQDFELFDEENLEKSTLQVLRPGEQTPSNVDIVRVARDFHPGATAQKRDMGLRFARVPAFESVETVNLQLAGFPLISLHSENPELKNVPGDNCFRGVLMVETTSSDVVRFVGWSLPLLTLVGLGYWRSKGAALAVADRERRKAAAAAAEERRHADVMAKLQRETEKEEGETRRAAARRRREEIENPPPQPSVIDQKKQEYKSKREIDFELEAFEEIEGPTVTALQREKALRRVIAKIESDVDLPSEAKQRLKIKAKQRFEESGGGAAKPFKD